VSLRSDLIGGIRSSAIKAVEAPGAKGPAIIREATGGGGTLQQIGSAFVRVAKSSRRALLAGPDGLITKDPTMRNRYIPQFKGAVNLKTVHDVKVSNAPQLADLSRLRELAKPTRRL